MDSGCIGRRNLLHDQEQSDCGLRLPYCTSFTAPGRVLISSSLTLDLDYSLTHVLSVQSDLRLQLLGCAQEPQLDGRWSCGMGG